MPNGKIASSISDFANAYALGTGCPKIKPLEDAKSDPGCEKIFGWGSSLRACYPFVDRNKFKKACDISVATGNKNALLNHASHYACRCWKDHIPAVVPAEIGENPSL